MLFGMGYAKLSRWLSLSAAFCVCAALPLAGCGGKSASVSTPPPVQAITISVQPLSQIIPPGGTATFAVAATSTAPLSYQWSENGVEIAGATSASYTTPEIPLDATVPSTIGSYVATVSNSSTSIASDTATLTAGPRSPKPGDLRYLLFQQVSIPWTWGGTVFRGDNTEVSFANTLGSPLYIGGCNLNDGCAWGFQAINLPPSMTGLSMNYNLGFNNLGSGYPSVDSDLQSTVAPNVVINSLDIETTMGTYAVSSVETAQTGGFDYKLETVPVGANQQAQIQATAVADGEASRVITAVSFNDASQLAYLISYGWTGDTSTVYEAQTIVVTPDNVGSAAVTLAGEGYVITAFGGNPTDGYILIGMRVQGDGLPRPISTGDGFLTTPDSAYSTTVVYFFPGPLVQEK